MELGLLPDIFFSLTVNELNALYAHHQKEQAWSREMAAYSGYVAAAAVATWYSEGLPRWEEFYKKPVEPSRETTSEEYIERYNSWT